MPKRSGTRWLVVMFLSGTGLLAPLLTSSQAPRRYDVTIYRDRYGVPHAFGRTDADAVYGFAYAQAEDNFAQLEDNYVRALGRAAELYGEGAAAGDRQNRLLEIPRLAREEYARAEPEVKQLVEAFADGVNRYLETHPSVQPRLLTRIEPWYPLAFIRFVYYQGGFLPGGVRSHLDAPAARALDDRSEFGSNGWVVSPARSASGRALLFINPHLPFFGPGQVYEGHVRSESGWSFSGYTRLGFPLPYVGHNASLGWVSTDNNADVVDVYRETIPADRPSAYRYGDGFRDITTWTDTIRVRTGSGLDTRVLALRKTHHGPIVREGPGVAYAVRMARLADDGWLAEWYGMTRAHTVAELRQAMTPLAMLFGNVMAADREGNTFYLYNGAVPRRDPSFDWQRPVDGSDPRTEWQGFLGIDELPQLGNPPSGWMQNCNGTPFLLTDVGNPSPSRFPAYIVQEPDNRRSQNARRLLASRRRWSFEDLVTLAFDTRVLAADSMLPALLAEFDALADDAETRRRLADPIGVLRSWDRRATTESEATTLFVVWRSAYEERRSPGRLGALDSAVERLTRAGGQWRRAWGDVNRLQRWNDLAGLNADDARPSLPVAGVPSADGAVFTFNSAARSGSSRRYGRSGASYVSVVEFGPRVRAVSVHVFGASGDSASPHYDDQARLYARGRFKPAWSELPVIRANIETSHRP